MMWGMRLKREHSCFEIANIQYQMNINLETSVAQIDCAAVRGTVKPITHVMNMP
jgi:hypothetical protein